MSGCSYVEKRGSKYYFRVRVPVDIAAITGQTHVVVALGTADTRVAKIRSARLFFEIAAFLETMRLRMAQLLNFEGEDDDRLAGLAAQAFALGQEFEARQESLAKEFSARLKHLVASLRHDFSFADVPTAISGRTDTVATFAPSSEHFSALPPQIFAQRPPAAAPASPAWTTLRQAFLDDKPGLTPKTIWSYNQAFDAWESLIKNKPIGNIRRADVKAFADFLRDKPNARGGGLNYKSIERSLGHIKNFMAWAVAAGHVENDHFGDVKGRDRTREERMAPDSRRAFTAAELQKLFSSRLFRKPENETEKAAAWFLAIAALTGARTDEIASAPAELVKLGDTWCLDLSQVGTKTQAG